MNHVERFRAVMAFQAVDRLPRWEWAMWWDQTIDRWHGEGLPRELRFSQVFDIARYFGLDPYQQFWFSTTDATIEATQHHVEGMVSNMDDYLRIRPQLFPEHDSAIRGMSSWAVRQGRGEAVVWSTLEGFFWFPRTLMGFEKMMYAYVDEPELLHQILFSEEQLRHVLTEYLRYYHHERIHQGINKIIEPQHEGNQGEIICTERLGGLLKSYHRRAA